MAIIEDYAAIAPGLARLRGARAVVDVPLDRKRAEPPPHRFLIRKDGRIFDAENSA
ncbi:MAG: hypothetical protein JO001_07295 [Alphaproteobacteria bacterium]|nr:hypothetical protein [Alphaproteobacteria bacterium]